MLSVDPTVAPRGATCNSATAAIPRILLVDDEPSILRSLARAFRALRPSWHVRVAENGSEALCHLERVPYDAVVTDLEMPVLDGIGLLQRMRSEHPKVIRLVHSSRIETDGPERLGSLAQGALAKPAHPDRLIQLIESALAQQAA